MGKKIFISNRLPIRIEKDGNEFALKESIGGLATGLKAFHRDSENLWMGWCGLKTEELEGKEKQLSDKLRKDFRYQPVFLNEEELDLYYQGFSNSTLWPLFHYFPNLTTFDEKQWDSYVKVNRIFLESLKEIMEPDDTLWIHDYQLMLLPGLIRKLYPGAAIGFFLHIPFPSFEIFRLLPWRMEILEGILGADLVGFHTYDYTRHFLSSTRRLLGCEQEMNFIKYHSRTVRADVFPMGIDYEYFSSTTAEAKEDSLSVDKIRGSGEGKILFSVDRLDYTKGIPERIRAFSLFLEKYPEYREEVSYLLIVAPSRTQVEYYMELLKEIQEMVSETNGRHGTLGWVPIQYFYRSFPQETLISLYKSTDAMMVTPLRDGMNLVAKEFLSARTDMGGVLILSETAGAAHELGEAVIVNSNNTMEMAEGIKTALEMPAEEKIKKNSIMNERLKRYNIHYWAEDFLEKLELQVKREEDNKVIPLNAKEESLLAEDYRKAEKRILFLDYDGTLVDFKPKPEMASPDGELLALLSRISANEKNRIVIISGRDKVTLEKWLGSLPVDLVASHGLWIRERGEDHWRQTEMTDNSWKQEIRPILEMTMDRTPGSIIEEKEFSLAWHYRVCEPELAGIRLRELKDALYAFTSSGNIGLLEGKKVLEIKDTTVNKGRTAGMLLSETRYDFIFAAGDDMTDEDLFSLLDKKDHTIKVGKGESQAGHYVKDPQEIRKLLEKLADL